MATTTLTEMDPATLAALAKMVADAAKVTRDALEVGSHKVDTTVTLSIGAEVKVLEDQEGVLTPQKAKPWNLVHVLLEEVNTMRAAAGLAGIDLAKVVEMAEAVDEKIVQKAQDLADAAMAKIKEPTRSSRKGAVKVKGTASLA